MSANASREQAELAMGEGQMQPSPSALQWAVLAVTVVGWLAAYRSSVRAQRRLLLDKALDTARLEIVRALRAYQGSLSDLKVGLLLLRQGVTMQWTDARWYGESERLNRLVHHPSVVDMVCAMEEYQILFPETLECRNVLALRSQALSRAAGPITLDLMTPATRLGAIGRAAVLFEELTDEQALLEDVRVHLQNRALSKLTGTKVPARQPKDAAVPRFLMVKGQLRLMDAKGRQLSNVSDRLQTLGDRPVETSAGDATT
jgi:hypothetical protein